MDRTVVVDGEAYLVSYAVCTDQSCPAQEFLEALRTGVFPGPPSTTQDEQVYDHARLLAKILYFANYGEPRGNGHMNALNDGIWEFKSAEMRMSFFDTDGAGGYTPKMKLTDGHPDWNADNNFPEVPNFDEDVRLGHCFGKTDQFTTENDLGETLRVRKEDLSHDRKA